MNSTANYHTISICFLIGVSVSVCANGLNPADSLRLSEKWWDKGFEQYERGNYQEAYDLFVKSYDFWNKNILNGEKNPYIAMNHCLYKMGKTDLIDKLNAPSYYEELDTTNFFSPDLQAAASFVYKQDIDNALLIFHRTLREDTLINRQNRRVHAVRFAYMTDVFSKMGYYQYAIDCLHKEYSIKEKYLPKEHQYQLDFIKQRLIEAYLKLGQSDSALVIAQEYANTYKNGKIDHFFLEYEQAENYLFNTYLKTGKHEEAFKEIEFADSAYQALEGKYYSPLYKLRREVDYYRAIGRYDKAYNLTWKVDSIQHADSTLLWFQEPREIAISSSHIGYHKKSVEILDSIFHSYPKTNTDSPILSGLNEMNDIYLLADAYYFDGQLEKALEKYLLLDSLYIKFLNVQDSIRNTEINFAATLYKISRVSYYLGLDSLGDVYYERLKKEIKQFKALSQWEDGVILLDAIRAIHHGDIMAAISYGEQLIKKNNGNVHTDVKEWISYWYIRVGLADRAYEIESEIVKNKKNAILDNFEELPENERNALWLSNTFSFKNLLWSIIMKRDETLFGQIYDDIALFSKGLLLTVSSNPNYKRVLSINWKDIRNNLKKDEMAVEFLTVPDFTSHSDSTIYLALYLKKGMEQPLCRYLCLGEELKNLSANTEKCVWNQGLYDIVWGSLEDEMKGITNIYFSADGYLHKIPIEYLVSNQSKIKFHAYRLTSTREIVIQQKRKNIDNAVLYGGLEYQNKSYSPLMSTKEEIDTIAHFLRNSGTTFKKYHHHEGTVSSLLAYNHQPLSLLHLATHGGYYKENEDTTDSNRLLLIQDNNVSKEERAMSHSWLVMADGILTAKDIARLQIKNLQLVTMSACDSALGDITDGEGVFGLQRAFKQAGTRSILMSLWKVRDKATSFFMGHFYKRVCKGDSFQKALANTQKYMKEYTFMGRKVFNAPEYWAGFVLLDSIEK